MDGASGAGEHFPEYRAEKHLQAPDPFQDWCGGLRKLLFPHLLLIPLINTTISSSKCLKKRLSIPFLESVSGNVCGNYIKNTEKYLFLWQFYQLHTTDCSKCLFLTVSSIRRICGELTSSLTRYILAEFSFCPEAHSHLCQLAPSA